METDFSYAATARDVWSPQQLEEERNGFHPRAFRENTALLIPSFWTSGL